jgi:hypothetical protein
MNLSELLACHHTGEKKVHIDYGMGLTCRCQKLPKGSRGRPCEKCKARKKARAAKAKCCCMQRGFMQGSLST